MRTFRLRGFPSGSSVTLAVEQNGRRAAAAVTEWGVAGTLKIRVLKLPEAMVAPASVYLEALADGIGVASGDMAAGEYDPSFHEVEYFWTVSMPDDPGYVEERYKSPVNLLDVHKIKSRKYGKRIAHVLERAGTYRFECYAVNIATGATTGVAAEDFTVVSPDEFFSPAQTYLVAADRNFAGAPVSAGRFFGIGDAISAGREQTNRLRIRLKRGANYSGLGRIRDGSGTLKTVFVDTWGEGERPRLVGRTWIHSGGQSQDSISTITYSGFEFTNAFGTGLNQDQVVTFHDCGGNGADNNLIQIASSSNSWICFGDCDFLAFEGIPFLGAAGNATALIGCRVAHHPDTPSSDPATDVARGSYGIRNSGEKALFCASQCDIFHRKGWFDNIRSIQTTQSAFRLNSAASGGPGSPTIVERCCMEAGYNVIEDRRVGGMGVMTNTLIERNLMIGVHDTRSFISKDAPSLTFRNNHCLRPPSRSAQGSFDTLSSFVSVGGDAGIDQPVRVYNNTLIDMVEGSTSPNVRFAAALTNATETNNLHHQSYGAIDAGPFDLTKIVTPRFKGYWDTEASTGNILAEPEYFINSNSATGPFQDGESVVGSQSGSVRTYRRSDGNLLFFDTVAEPGPTSTERFLRGEMLVGQLSGATAVAANGQSTGQQLESGYYDTLLVPGTPTPTHMLTYSDLAGSFTEGATLSSDTSSAMICQVIALTGSTGVLYLRDVSGHIGPGAELTDDASGVSATSSSQMESAGTGALWHPAEGCSALGDALRGPVALTDFFGERRPAYPCAGALEAKF